MVDYKEMKNLRRISPRDPQSGDGDAVIAPPIGRSIVEEHERKFEGKIDGVLKKLGEKKNEEGKSQA